VRYTDAIPIVLTVVVLWIILVDNSRTQEQIRLKKAEWYCVEYAPGAAGCTVYRKVGSRAEDAQ